MDFIMGMLVASIVWFGYIFTVATDFDAKVVNGDIIKVDNKIYTCTKRSLK